LSSFRIPTCELPSSEENRQKAGGIGDLFVRRPVAAALRQARLGGELQQQGAIDAEDSLCTDGGQGIMKLREILVNRSRLAVNGDEIAANAARFVANAARFYGNRGPNCGNRLAVTVNRAGVTVNRAEIMTTRGRVAVTGAEFTVNRLAVTSSENTALSSGP
jgi:hypothetical protein